MQTLDRVVRRSAGGHHAIELPFAGLRRIGFALTHGQLGMVAAGPGVGKSAFAQQVALLSGLRTLYVSADSPPWVMTVRALAFLTGHPQTYIVQCLEGGYQADEIDAALYESANVQYSFDTFTTKEIEEDVAAYATVHGEYPELVVVDNVRNFTEPGDSEVGAQQRVMEQLHKLAIATGAHVLALHHATGAYHDGDKPVPLGGIENKITQLPAQVLTLYRNDAYVVACPVKNRMGKADPSAKSMQVRLRFDGERQTFTDLE